MLSKFHLLPHTALRIGAHAILLLALALVIPPLAVTERLPSNHHRTPSSAAEDYSNNDSVNRKLNTRYGWTSKTHDWIPRSCARRGPGFAFPNGWGWGGRLALCTGRRGRVSSNRVARDTRFLTGRWRQGWGLNRRHGSPERSSSVAIDAGTGETEFYSW